eukprot:TRINITY_DN43775_c0_g1_i1.p1 TRINITY_DN43775_c0_g1~~TRINITY_DN43775_c0_g1_i1.p1  ORF type:complete len:615 (+),score=216.32 TRINITY_DN43775_c0_g1_i1:63-1907(+)
MSIARVSALGRQGRSIWGVANVWENNPIHFDNKKQVIHLYRLMLQSCAFVKAQYNLNIPLPMMKQRCRMLIEMNKNVRDPATIRYLVLDGIREVGDALGMLFTHKIYLTSRYFGTGMDHTVLAHTASVYNSREITLGRKRLREKAKALVSGDGDIQALPGPVLDEDGNRIGYYHPKGPLPAGESELFARPPEYSDWGNFSLPDPWNPENSPNGPPDPHLVNNTDHTYRVNLARMGPYNRHRTRRLIEHEKKTRVMGEADFLEYFGENEVHYAANQFELPEYEWAESRLSRRLRRCKHENQEIFAPAREQWIEQYKGQWKAVNYGPAMEYWRLVFNQWVPNYNKEVVESVDKIDDVFDRFLSEPANYAAYRSAVFEATLKDAGATPLARTQLDFVSGATPDAPDTASRPYDHPQFTDKWFTDNGLERLLLQQEDVEAGLGCSHKHQAVLQAELSRLKEEVGCAELTEQRFTGEWWNRGHIKLLRTLEKMHHMELARAINKAAGVQQGATQEEAESKIKAKDWKGFQFTEFSYLRYPDGHANGVHAWAVASGEDQSAEDVLRARWWQNFQQIFNYEQCVPVWVQGLSRRTVMNKPAEQGGWTLKGAAPFYDKLVSA